MPQANIQRAIDRGIGKGDGAKLEEITYEGYGPGSVAVMVKVLTDNRNRSAADIRSAFTKAGGKLGSGGTVAWMFEPKAIIRVSEADPTKQEDLSLIAIEAGAVDVDMGDELIVYATPESLRAIQDQLRGEGAELASELTLEPKDSVQVNDEVVVKRIMSFLDALEEMDEVVETYSNFDTALELSEIE
jgi:YebC/PmpR family DNA-binding regulatory protein